MAGNIEVPFTGQEVDPSSPRSAVMTVVMLIAGFGIFAMASDIGDYVASVANSTLAGYLGFNPATGEDSDQGIPGV